MMPSLYHRGMRRTIRGLHRTSRCQNLILWRRSPQAHHLRTKDMNLMNMIHRPRPWLQATKRTFSHLTQETPTLSLRSQRRLSSIKPRTRTATTLAAMDLEASKQVLIHQPSPMLLGNHPQRRSLELTPMAKTPGDRHGKVPIPRCARPTRSLSMNGSQHGSRKRNRTGTYHQST